MNSATKNASVSPFDVDVVPSVCNFYLKRDSDTCAFRGIFLIFSSLQLHWKQASTMKMLRSFSACNFLLKKSVYKVLPIIVCAFNGKENWKERKTHDIIQFFSISINISQNQNVRPVKKCLQVMFKKPSILFWPISFSSVFASSMLESMDSKGVFFEISGCINGLSWFLTTLNQHHKVRYH